MKNDDLFQKKFLRKLVISWFVESRLSNEVLENLILQGSLQTLELDNFFPTAEKISEDGLERSNHLH